MADELATAGDVAALDDAVAGFVLVKLAAADDFPDARLGDALAGLAAAVARRTACADCWAMTEEEQTPTVNKTAAIRNDVNRVFMVVFLTD